MSVFSCLPGSGGRGAWGRTAQDAPRPCSPTGGTSCPPGSPQPPQRQSAALESGCCESAPQVRHFLAGVPCRETWSLPCKTGYNATPEGCLHRRMQAWFVTAAKPGAKQNQTPKAGVGMEQEVWARAVFGPVCATRQCQLGTKSVQSRKRNGPALAGAQGDSLLTGTCWGRHSLSNGAGSETCSRGPSSLPVTSSSCSREAESHYQKM